jgi:hypothetical protein
VNKKAALKIVGLDHSTKRGTLKISAAFIFSESLPRPQLLSEGHRRI